MANPNPPIPVDRYLVPAELPAPPEEFITIDQPVAAGLPHVIDLESDTKLLLIAPSGLIVDWRDGDPSSVFSRSDEQNAAFVARPDEPVGDAFRAPVQLLLTVGGSTVAAAPLVAGVRQFLPHREIAGVQIELIIRSWQLRTGTLRGPGDFGSRISLAWRRASNAINNYSTPPPNPVLIPRMPPENRTESTLGLRRIQPLLIARFSLKRTFIR